ncbi:major facilitator superfamily domain-containing protein [Aspergillus avenaceus]|uniref:Major facilitator superfamily domain-containing protein n=1 Tax=Aspergillus avenaceus TaxID=36643 RepID=A0A5N6U3M3_ASPAV|nr:major facilitator superfamily domain-containing protein [Aspergillus avenaceus]
MSTTQTETILLQPTHSHVAKVGPVPVENGNNSSAEDVRLVTTNQSSRLQQVLVTIQLFMVTLTPSVTNGIVTVGLPTITEDLKLPPSLAFWPASVNSLATASTLLLAGSIADAVGPRWVELIGSFAGGAFMIAQGAARTGEELVGLRAIQGVGLALHLSSSVALITQIMPSGRGRNLAFSFLGLSQPLGFSLGLVLGGVLIDTIGWRAGWYLAGGITILFTVIGLWALPKGRRVYQRSDVMHNIKTKIDWIGALLASAFMALLCYLLAILSSDPSRIKQKDSIIILCFTVMALPLFVFWVHRQVKINRPALIPNSLWKNKSFSTICATIALSYAVINSMELFTSLFFQEVQHLSALQASIRILPSLVVGVLMNVAMGLFVDRIPAVWIVTVTSFLCAGSPLLMAVIQPSWPYWANAFVGQLLQPVSVDALFTVGLIVITDVFPDDTQALAGAVFNTAAQFGSALGMAILQVISTLITEDRSYKEEVQARMDGYRASFWTMFGFMILCMVIGFLGLRKTGKVGLKRD